MTSTFGSRLNWRRSHNLLVCCGARGHMIMKRKLNLLLVSTACLIGLAACGWNPPCPTTTLTDPWRSMNLPVQQDAAVCASTPDKFQAAHKGEREEVSKMYLDALQKGGWNLTRKDLGGTYYLDFDKGNDKITVEIYDWQRTGVIIRKR